MKTNTIPTVDQISKDISALKADLATVRRAMSMIARPSLRRVDGYFRLVDDCRARAAKYRQDCGARGELARRILAY